MSRCSITTTPDGDQGSDHGADPVLSGPVLDGHQDLGTVLAYIINRRRRMDTPMVRALFLMGTFPSPSQCLSVAGPPFFPKKSNN